MNNDDKISNELRIHNLKMQLDTAMDAFFAEWIKRGVTHDQGQLILRLMSAKMLETGHWLTEKEFQDIWNKVHQSELTDK